MQTLRPVARFSAVVGLIGTAFGACGDAGRITELADRPEFVISDGTTGGTPGFYFLAPLVTPPQGHRRDRLGRFILGDRREQ